MKNDIPINDPKIFKEPLSKAEERAYLELYHTTSDPNIKAKIADKIVRSNLKFVARLAIRYAKFFKLPSEDLFSGGKIELYNALNRYDLSNKVRFLSYASFYIKLAFLEVLKVSRPMIYNNVVGKDNKLEDHENPSKFHYISIYQNVAGLDDDILLGDTIPLDEEGPDLLFEEKDYHRSLIDCVKALPAREHEIVTRYFGLEGKAPQTMKEISTHVKISKERVRQILNKVYPILRDKLD